MDEGRLLVSSSMDKTIKIWALDEFKYLATSGCLCTLTSHSSGVTSLAPISCGYLASGSKDKTINIWHIFDTDKDALACDSDSKPIVCLTGHAGRIAKLTTLNNGKSLCSASSDSVMKIWTFAEKQKKLNKKRKMIAKARATKRTSGRIPKKKKKNFKRISQSSV